METNAGEENEDSSCEWGNFGDAQSFPSGRLDHAPWLDAYRQVYFESKLYNRTLMRSYEKSGHPPPPCMRTLNLTNASFSQFECGGIEPPLCEDWEQYWAEWEEEWAGPPDTGTDFAQIRYKMPPLPDEPPVSGLMCISVEEKPMFTERLFPDSIPRGWPEALDDVLHERYDKVKRIMGLSKALLEAASMGDLETAVQLLREGALVHTGDSNNQYMTHLHHAAFHGHVELIYVLVQEEGAHLDRTTLGGETALHKAVQRIQYIRPLSRQARFAGTSCAWVLLALPGTGLGLEVS